MDVITISTQPSMMHRLNNHPLQILLYAAALPALIGCGKSGVQRLDLQGSVTHDGAPVPAGDVRFEPDASRGGRGPVGFAAIVDGKFDTRTEDKGPVPGPVRITVNGYASGEAFAPSLFPQYTYTVDLESGSNAFAIEVPSKSGKK